MEKNKKGEWIVTSHTGFIGWEIEWVEGFSFMEARVMLVNKKTKERRVVIASKLLIPIASIERKGKSE